MLNPKARRLPVTLPAEDDDFAAAVLDGLSRPQEDAALPLLLRRARQRAVRGDHAAAGVLSDAHRGGDPRRPTRPRWRDGVPAGGVLVEFGSGSSLKTEILLRRAAAAAGLRLHRCIGRALCEDAKRVWQRGFQASTCGRSSAISPIPSRCRPISPSATRPASFPGSTIGNLTPSEAGRLLRVFRAVLSPGGRLIVGVDLKKDARRLVLAYNDAAGVTAAFNLNLLARINRELGGTFDLDGVPARGGLQPARGPHRDAPGEPAGAAGQRFADGDSASRPASASIRRTPTSTRSRQFQELARSAGWQPQRVWTDEGNCSACTSCARPDGAAAWSRPRLHAMAGHGESAAIAIRDVTKRFGDGPAVLDGVSLSVRAGRIPGRGRRVRLRQDHAAAAYQSPARPEHGHAADRRADVQSLDPVALRRRIGYVFQEVGLFPHMTVAENIAITPRLLGWDRARRAARVDELLELVRLDASYRGRAFRPSCRAASASASASRGPWRPAPEIVLMDEPFAALDPLTRDGLGQDYRRLHETLRLTTVMITHDMLEALGLADRIVVLRAGRVIADGAPSAAHGQRARLRARADADAAEDRRACRGVAGRQGALGGDARFADAWRACPTISATMCWSASRRWRWASRLSFPLALASLRRPGAARRCCWRPPASCKPSRAWRCWRCSIPLLLGCGGADRSACSAIGFSALGFLPAVLALALYSMLPVVRNTITGIVGIDPAIKQAALGRRHDRAAVAHDGRAAAGAAGDHGRRAHGVRVGDRHRHAVDADRSDQPRQLHLHRPADAELDLRAVWLRRRRGAGAGRRPAAGADRARLLHAPPQPHGRRRHRARL